MRLKVVLPLAIFLAISAPLRAAYNPLDPISTHNPEPTDRTLHDAARNRDLPIRVYLPASSAAAPVVLFSHGLGGSRDVAPYLGKQWASRGYVAVMIQHPGSDESVWKSVPAADRMSALKKAASAANFLLRVHDVPAVIDALTAFNAAKGDPLFGRLDLDHLAMAGHSFGAVTTQALSGQTFTAGDAYTDPRIKAAVVLSPSTSPRGSAKQAFGSVHLPWLLITGSKDVSPIGEQTVATRSQVFPALPAGDKFQVVFDGATHASLVGAALPGEDRPDGKRITDCISALSTAFLDDYLKHDPAAKAWLESDAPQAILKPADMWEKR